MEGGTDVLYAALGAVIVMGSLFGFGLLAERLFVSRREFEQFKDSLEARITKVEHSIEKVGNTVESKHDQVMQRLDLLFPKREG